MHLRHMDDFNHEWISPGFQNWWFDDTDKPKIVKAEYFREKHENAKDLENKVVIGFIIQFKIPNKRAAVRGQVSRLINDGGTKRRAVQQTADIPYQLMLVCLDVLNLPHTFSVLFQRKQEYMHLYGHVSLCEQVSLGDCLAFFEASESTDTVGENITILRSPTACSKINPPETLPMCPARRSSDKMWVGWYLREQKIMLSQLQLKVGGDNVPCTGIACDRQNKFCKGCFGKSPCLHTIVLEYTVELMDQKEYNPTGTALFPCTRSYKFSKLFFKNIDSVAALPEDTIRSCLRQFRKKIDSMVNYINTHGGWTCVGWHRQGQIHDQSSDEMLESSKTDGHIVRLEPSNPKVLTDETFHLMIIDTPDLAQT